MEEEYYEELQLQIDVDVFRCEEALQELQAERAARNAIFAEEYEFEYEVDAALAVAEQVAAERKEMAAEQYRREEESWLTAEVERCEVLLEPRCSCFASATS